MKMNNIRTAILTTAALGACGVATLLVHVGCKQDGSGGGGLSDLGKQIAQVGGDIGGQVTGHQEISRGVAAAVKYTDQISIGPQDEDAMGQSVAMNLTASAPLTKDEKLNKYVSLVGLSVVDASARPVGNWLFGVLDSNEVNAFAGPNGYIFVTTGALRRMQDESELAGVLAHEVTHVLHHHSLAEVHNNANADLLKEAAAIKTAGHDQFGVFNKLSDPVVEGVLKKGYARDQELDADKTAISLVAAAGYDPNGLVRFLQRLESSGGGTLMSTHPGKTQRIAAAQAEISRLGNPQGKTLKDRFSRNVILK
jgi:predicted Zn-dependent protease